MQITLTDEEKARLEKQHKGERDKQTSDRIKAVLLRSENWSFEQIGQVLRADTTLVKRYLMDYLCEKSLGESKGD
jgi:predicted ArsR family transcriptional regulator